MKLENYRETLPLTGETIDIISEKALAVALVANTLFSFFASAFNQAMLQTEMVLQADKSGMIDNGRLHR